MCKYTILEEKDFILAEDDPNMKRLYELIDNYFKALCDLIEKIGNCLHAKFCEVAHLNKHDSDFVETLLCKVVHPGIADMIDGMEEKESEILISSLEEIYSLMSCVQKNSRCEKRSIILQLIKLTKASRAYKNFNCYLISHNKKN